MSVCVSVRRPVDRQTVGMLVAEANEEQTWVNYILTNYN